MFGRLIWKKKLDFFEQIRNMATFSMKRRHVLFFMRWNLRFSLLGVLLLCEQWNNR